MEIPIFPLNGAVLFPETSLPLNIFEDRYIEMVNYSLARDRHIGMIQADEYNNLYKIGCIGKIHSFNETSDGRYLISLKGINCFRVIKEIDKKFSFRLVSCEIINRNENTNDLNNIQKNVLLDKYKEYIKLKNINLNIDEIEAIELSQLIKFIAMVSPFKNEDKQILLETNKLNEFYKKLISIIELDLVGDITNRTIN
tara:strand:- start:1664 stop:2257 length:594 start_codon:yes stop_codon:yes gene_type:complete